MTAGAVFLVEQRPIGENWLKITVTTPNSVSFLPHHDTLVTAPWTGRVLSKSLESSLDSRVEQLRADRDKSEPGSGNTRDETRRLRIDDFHGVVKQSIRVYQAQLHRYPHLGRLRQDDTACYLPETVECNSKSFKYPDCPARLDEVFKYENYSATRCRRDDLNTHIGVSHFRMRNQRRPVPKRTENGASCKVLTQSRFEG